MYTLHNKRRKNKQMKEFMNKRVNEGKNLKIKASMNESINE